MIVTLILSMHMLSRACKRCGAPEHSIGLPVDMKTAFQQGRYRPLLMVHKFWGNACARASILVTMINYLVKINLRTYHQFTVLVLFFEYSSSSITIIAIFIILYQVCQL